MQDGWFAIVNLVPGPFVVWHIGELDHTPNDTHGYMLLINAAYDAGTFFNATVQNLCAGERYELSVYAANIVKKPGLIKPDISFVIQTTTDHRLIAQLTTAPMSESDPMTWLKYGISFEAITSSVLLLMISEKAGGSGNDLVIDDIALRICSANRTSGICA